MIKEVRYIGRNRGDERDYFKKENFTRQIIGDLCVEREDWKKWEHRALRNEEGVKVETMIINRTKEMRRGFCWKPFIVPRKTGPRYQ